jgi:prevent-host-death family protein
MSQPRWPTMRTVSAMDLRRRMGELLDRASAGERIVIERDRRPLAVLVPYEEGLKLEDSPEDAQQRALAALDSLDAFALRMAAEYPHLKELPDTAMLVREERKHSYGTA